MNERPNRRDFLRGCALGAGTLLVPDVAKAIAADGGRATPATAAASQIKSRVVVARDAALRGGGSEIDPARLGKMLDRAVQSFFDTKSPLDAWKRLVKPGEVIGLKVNCLGGRAITTNHTLIEAVIERLKQVGIAPKDIVIFDRSDRDLERGGFTPPEWKGVRAIGNNVAGFEDEFAEHGSVASRFSKTLTRTCDGVVNLPVLKDHGMAGFTLAMKAMYGVINNPNKYHPNGGDPYIADLNMLPVIRQKVRLTIGDATTAIYEGGPGYSPQWAWQFNGLLVGRDPVALDTVGWQMIEQKRKEAGLPTLAEAGREPKYIATAADEQHRLGTNDLKRIERVEV